MHAIALIDDVYKLVKEEDACLERCSQLMAGCCFEILGMLLLVVTFWVVNLFDCHFCFLRDVLDEYQDSWLSAHSSFNYFNAAKDLLAELNHDLVSVYSTWRELLWNLLIHIAITRYFGATCNVSSLWTGGFAVEVFNASLDNFKQTHRIDVSNQVLHDRDWVLIEVNESLLLNRTKVSSKHVHLKVCWRRWLL